MRGALRSSALVVLSLGLTGCEGGGEGTSPFPLSGLIERVFVNGNLSSERESHPVLTDDTVEVEVTGQTGVSLTGLSVTIDPEIESIIESPERALIRTDEFPGPYAVTLTVFGERSDGLLSFEHFEFTLEVESL